MPQNTRSTQQRRLIMELMEGNYGHPTADEVYELARAKEPHISRGTVYRNLNLLSEENRIRRLTMPIGPDHFDCNIENHYHFLCHSCFHVFDTNIKYKESLNADPAGMPGFRTEWHRLILVGLCPECAAKEKKEI